MVICNIITVSHQAQTTSVHLELHYTMFGKRHSKLADYMCEAVQLDVLYESLIYKRDI